MNSISKLSDHDLLNNTKALVNEEKRLTQIVLDHLEEIEYRKLYLERGFSSLLDYCVNELKYSESSGHRRISAMRVIRKIPQAKEKLKSGLVNLSTLAKLNGFLRREEKVKSYTSTMKLELLEKIEGKSQDQCDREFIKISPIEVSFKENQRPITDEFTQITFVASQELKAKLDLLKNLLAHRNSTKSMAELIELLTDMALKKLDPIKTERQKQKTAIDEFGLNSNAKIEALGNGPGDRTLNKTDNNTVHEWGVESGQNKSSSPAVLHRSKSFTKSSTDSRYIPASIKEYVWKRDKGCCQYTDKETNKKCESKFALQIDHVHPFSLGGSNHQENLRLLCRAHNNWRTNALY